MQTIIAKLIELIAKAFAYFTTRNYVDISDNMADGIESVAGTVQSGIEAVSDGAIAIKETFKGEPRKKIVIKRPWRKEIKDDDLELDI